MRSTGGTLTGTGEQLGMHWCHSKALPGWDGRSGGIGSTEVVSLGSRWRNTGVHWEHWGATDVATVSPPIQGVHAGVPQWEH